MTNPNKRFGSLLNDGITSIVHKQPNKTKKAEIEQRIGEEIGYAPTSVQRWQRGYVPPQIEVTTFLVRYCVTHGRMDRFWAASILAQAQYPNSELLLAELFPKHLEHEVMTRPCHNLPPRYGDFLGRQADQKRVLEGLASRWPLISIEGLGGVGKTTLAIETANCCLPGTTTALDLPFTHVVWVSAKDKPEQKQWLNDVLDTVAQVLDHPYIAQLAQEYKADKVDILLRTPTRRVLLIIDNFETIEDHDLVQWLQKVPEPNKVLITSRHAQLRTVWPVHLSGLDEEDALILIRNHIARLGLEALRSASTDTIRPLARVTEGNPKAIEMALGHVKYGGLRLNEVVDHLHSASRTVNDIFKYLFDHTWEVLTPDARDLLQVVPFFVDTACKDALGAASGLAGYQLDTALERLVELSLLDVYEKSASGVPRYTTHSLVRAFVHAGFNSSVDWERAARDRWIAWYQTLALQAGDPGNYENLRMEIDNLLAAMSWLVDQGRISEMSTLYQSAQFLLFAEGQWEQALDFGEQVIAWGEATNDAELLATTLHTPFNVFRWRGDLRRQEAWLARLQLVAGRLQDELLQADVWLARGRLFLLHKKEDLTVAVEKEELAMAVKGVRKALAVFKHRTQWPKVVMALNILGNLYLHHKKFDLAKSSYLRGLQILESHADEIPTTLRWQAILDGNIALIEGRLGQHKVALEVLHRIVDDLYEQTDLAEVYVALALYEHHVGNLERAQSFRQRANQIKERLGLARSICPEDEEWQRLRLS
jgi:NB-ARC domain